MSGILVDSNVILDIITQDARWLRWSETQLIEAAERSPLFINPVIYSEVSMAFESIETLDDALSSFAFLDLPKEACFLAGKSLLKYRQRSGEKRSPLPDFFIGAHAAVQGLSLLTRDEARYKTYFPKLHIISP